MGEGIDLAAGVIHVDAWTFDNVLTVVGDDVALVVDFEHITKVIGTGAEVKKTRLRCTHACRWEDGEWKIFLRHADEFVEGGPRRGEGLGRRPPGGGPPGGGPPGGGPPGGGPPAADPLAAALRAAALRAAALRGGGPPGGGPPGGN